MKKVLLLHGYNGIPQIFHWLKQELENIEYTVIMPALHKKMYDIIYGKKKLRVLRMSYKEN